MIWGKVVNAGNRRVLVGVLVVALVASLVGAVPASAGAKPKVVLDADYGYATSARGGVTYNSFQINLAIARGVQALLPSVCAADIVVTNTGNSPDNGPRAAQMADADLAVTLSMNSLPGGLPWGSDPAEGGSSSFATNRPDNLALGNELVQQVGAYTTRPYKAVNTGSTNGSVYPYDEYKTLNGSYAQLFMLFIDNNFDFPVWHDTPDYLIRGVTAALGHTLQAKGFKCLGQFPALPSAAELQRLRNLGYQQYLRYGADPISMSTGNFVTSENMFKLSGLGAQVIDLTLNYNAQSAQDSPTGVGWAFPYGSYLQQYSDGTVVVFLPDGRGLPYAPAAGGGFTSPAGAFASLTQLDATTYKWSMTTGMSMTFAQDPSTGRGKLTSMTDRQGNSQTLAYNGSGALFPNLSGITDQAGQHVAVATNTEGRITSFTRPDGATWQLGYSATGDLTSLTSARGTVRHFNYDGQHRMVSEVGQDGVTFLTNGYDSQSRVVDQTNAFGQHRSIVYDNANHKTTYTDATGAVTVYHWNDLGEITQIDDPLGGHSKTEYNSERLPSKDTDPLNRSTARSYDPSGQVTSVTDPLGSVASKSYNGSGDLTSTTDQGGAGGSSRTVTLTVNGAGLPTTVTNPDGTTKTITYNVVGDATSGTDENGAVAGFGYDGRGNSTSVTDPLGRVTTMTYDLANRLTSATDPLGHTTSYEYDPNDNLTKVIHPNGSTELRTYDVNDQLASSTDRRGAVTTYTRDAELNLVAQTLPSGGTTKHTFDQENRLTSTTDALGNKTTYTLDALGRVTAVTDARGNTTGSSYKAAGEVASQTDATGAATTFVRDVNGRVLRATDPAGGVATSTWDQVGRQTSLKDPLGHTTSSTYNFRNQVVTTTDPAGGITKNNYDTAGRLIKKTDAAGASTTLTYDAAGQLTKETDALGNVTSYAYDAAGNQTSLTDPNGHVQTTNYDVMNQPTSHKDGNGHVTVDQLDAGGLLLARTDPLGNKTSHAYDSIGNLVSTRDPLNRTTSFGYDANQRPTKQTDPDGVASTRLYDPVGNLTAVVRNAKSGQPSSSTVNVTNRYSYDARNLLTSTTDPSGAITAYQYDVRGLRTISTDPLGKATSYGFDAAGNRVRRTDANGVVTNYTYDPRDLLTQRAYPAGSADAFAYDAVGRQVSAANAAGTVATTYDALGRATQVTDAKSKVLKYTYDAAGNRTGLTLPDGRTLAYTYDNANQLTKLVSPLGTMTTAYDNAGRPTLVTRPNGTKTTVAFDSANELTGLVTKAGSATLATFAYSYDSASNVSKRIQSLNGTSTTSTYAYDPLRRLTSDVGGPLPSTYTYDAAGNRLSWSAPDDPLTPKPSDPFVQTSVYNAAGQVTKSTKVRENGGATKTDVTTDTYDNNGNRLKADTIAQSPGQSASTIYGYDFENRLLTSMPGNDPQKGNGNDQRNQRRTYDALGRLATETRGTTTTSWTEDGLNPLIASDTATTLYLRDANGDLQGEQVTGSDPAWYVTDALGSVLGSTNSKSKLGNVTQYSDYGVKLGTSDRRMGFGGEIADPSYPGNGIGNDTPVLSQYYARSYDPGTGTWLQADPMPGTTGKPDSQSSYRFVASNPSTYTDLLGYTLSVGNYSGGTISGVSVATTPNNLSVGNYTQTWSSTSLNGGNLQSSGSAAHTLQPTVSGQYLQPTANPFLVGYRSPGSKGQLASIDRPGTGADLQGDNSLGGSIRVPGGLPANWPDIRSGFVSGGLEWVSVDRSYCLALFEGNSEFCGGSSVRETKDVEYAVYVAFGLSGLIKRGGSALLSRIATSSTSSSRISVTQQGLTHIVERHALNGSLSAGKSIFYETRSIPQLIVDAGRVSPVRQANGNLVYVVNAGRTIGVDRLTSSPTSIYTVVTKASGELVTAFPGAP